MIIGFDHIALSSKDLDESIERLQKESYTCAFFQKNIPNPLTKKSLLYRYEASHDMAVLHSTQQKLTVEVVCHGKLLHLPSSPLTWKNRTISLATRKSHDERRFWIEGMSFKDNSGILELKRPILQWTCSLEIQQDDRAVEDSRLDSTGYTCLAFVSNDLASDMKVAKEKGATDFTEIFPLRINGKDLELLMFRSPSGIIVELIKV